MQLYSVGKYIVVNSWAKWSVQSEFLTSNNFICIRGIIIQSTWLNLSPMADSIGRVSCWGRVCPGTVITPRSLGLESLAGSRPRAEELIPLYEKKRMSYHPGLDYCLFCWCKSDVSPIETILYEYSLKFALKSPSLRTQYSITHLCFFMPI